MFLRRHNFICRLKSKKPEKAEGSGTPLEKVSFKTKIKSLLSFKRGLLVRSFAVLSLGILMTSSLVQLGTTLLGDELVASKAADKFGTKSTPLERIKNQIEIASKKGDGSLTSGEYAMSPSEKKTVGFFLSNYYTPFTTRLYKGSSIPIGKFKSDVESILENLIGMNPKSAKELANELETISNMTQEKLYLAKSEDNGKTWKALKKQASYYEVLFGSVGIFSTEMLTAKGDDDFVSLRTRYDWNGSGEELLGLVTSKLSSGKIKRENISYEWTPDPSATNKTVSQSIFHANFLAVGEESWGSAFMTFDASDKKISKALKAQNPFDALADLFWKTSPNQPMQLDKGTYRSGRNTVREFYDRSIYSSGLYLDGFGNLISDTGSQSKSVSKYVILPASQNPMMYASKAKTEKAEGGEKEDDKDKEKGSPKKKNAKDRFNERMSEYFNDENSGVGRLLPVTNLNTMALISQGAVQLTGEGQGGINTDNAGGVNRTISAVYGGSKGFDQENRSLFGIYSFDQGDSGSLLNGVLYSQWLLRRVELDKSQLKKLSSDFSMNSVGVSTFGVDANAVRKGKADLLWLRTSDMYTNGTPMFMDSGASLTSFVDKANEVNGADTFASKFQSSVGSSDTMKFATSIQWNGGLIDQLVAFDKFNFMSPSLSDTSDTLKNGRISEQDDNGETLLSLQKFSSTRIKDGKWRGSGGNGSLGSTSGVSDTDIDSIYGVNIYVSTYLSRALPDNDKVGYVVNLENSPEIEDKDYAQSEEEKENMDVVLKNMAYHMLNPTKGREYKQRWSKTFANQVILVSLEDMVGANTASTYAGTTRYLELTGLASTPRLDEIRFTSILYEKFDTWGVFILIVASFVMLIFVFVGQMKVLPAVVAVLAFGFMIYTPPKMLDSMINLKNSASNYMFNDKFTFWVMATHQNYEDSVAQLLEEAQAGSYSNYTALLLQLQSGLGSEETGGETDVYEWQQTLGATIKVRWMAPKKDGYVNQVKRDFSSDLTDNTSKKDDLVPEGAVNLSSGLLKYALAKEDEEKSGDDKEKSDKEDSSEVRSDNLTSRDGAFNGTYSPLTSALMSQGLSGEDFTGLDTNYLYRGYTDIADYSRTYYGNIMGDNISGNGGQVFDIGSYTDSLSRMFPTISDGSLPTASDSVSASEQRKSIMDYLNIGSPDNDHSQTLLQRAKLGFTNDRKGSTANGAVQQSTLKRIYAPISSSTVSSSSTQDLSKITVGSEVGLHEDYFILSMNNFNDHNTPLSTQMAEANSSTTGKALEGGDATSLSVFALYTESPFYYMSWNLYDNGLSAETGSSGEFKTMMLEKNDSFFYNYQMPKGKAGYGALKDFMDFGSLFTVVIPYLRESNKTLLQWSDIYGTKPYDGYGVSSADLDAVPDKNSEAYYKTWFNYSADNAYRTYSAWVDALYDLDIAESEPIEYGGEKQVVDEPLNPASYKIRPMIFSESEMEYYGLTDDQLTGVEKAILKTSRDIRNRWLDLMNYYTLSDVVLNTNASMMATFAFNENFSQKGFNQNQVILEPQGYELKTFGFDAYLRMILQNATGESIAYNQSLKSDIYEIVAEKDGTPTLIGMWVLSFVVVYFVPTGVLLVLCTMPIAMMLSVMASFVRRDRSFAKTFAKDCLYPFMIVLLVDLFVAYVISTLMGNGGYSLVTGDLTGSHSFQSPRATIFFLLFVSVVLVIVYVLNCIALIKGVLRNGKLLTIPVRASVEMMSGAVVGGVDKVKDSVTGSSSARVSNTSGTTSSGGSGTGNSLAQQSEMNLGTTKSLRKRKRSIYKTRKSGNKPKEMSKYDKRAKKALGEILDDSKSRK